MRNEKKTKANETCDVGSTDRNRLRETKHTMRCEARGTEHKARGEGRSNKIETGDKGSHSNAETHAQLKVKGRNAQISRLNLIALKSLSELVTHTGVDEFTEGM